MSEDGKEARSLLDPGTVAELLRRLQATDIDELEVVQGNARLYLRRQPGQRQDHLPPRAAEPAGAAGWVVVAAPLAGAYYSRPSPEQSAFVSVGDSVEGGQVVGFIETMKLFNEVTAEVGGEVMEIVVSDGDLVEAAQPLLYIRPESEGDAP